MFNSYVKCQRLDLSALAWRPCRCKASKERRRHRRALCRATDASSRFSWKARKAWLLEGASEGTGCGNWKYVIIWNIRDCNWNILKSRVMLNVPKSHYRFVLLLSFSQVVGSLYYVIFPVGVKASLVESQQMSFFPFMSFHCLSCCICFPWCVFISFHFPFILHSCPL